jgi:hypothetical protein
MNIEDIIVVVVNNRIPLNSWDCRLVDSLFEQIILNNSLTEKQGNAVVKILKKYSPHISRITGKDIKQFLETPTYRLGIRTINLIKKAGIVEHEIFGKAIRMEFPFNFEIIQEIKNKKTFDHSGRWDSEEKVWIFPLNETNISHLSTIIRNYQFETDLELRGYIEQVEKIIENMDEHIPLLVLENNETKIRNFSQNLSVFDSKNILKSIFEARKMGILTWDDYIDEYLSSEIDNETTRDFLMSDPGQKFHVDRGKKDIFSLSDIILNMGPTLFIVPGGSELENLQNCFNFLTSIGIDQKEISVMFRLSQENHKSFNDFVKNQGLNNPISESTRAVFISGKLPKPLLKSKIKFHSVVNMGFDHAHYTMRDFVKNHENVVYYAEITIRTHIIENEEL